MWFEAIDKENVSIMSVSTVSADGLAPLGARASAGVVVNKFKSYWEEKQTTGLYISYA